MNQIAVSKTAGKVAITFRQYLRPLSPRLPILFSVAVAKYRSAFFTVRQFSSPTHTLHKIQSPATSSSSLISGASALVRRYNSSPNPRLNSYEMKTLMNWGIAASQEVNRRVSQRTRKPNQRYLD